MGCATSRNAEPIFINGSTGTLNESPIVATFEICNSVLNLPLSIKLTDDLTSYKYATLIASKTKNTGGWVIKHELKGSVLSYCIKGPAPMAAVTMALSTPYLVVGHNSQLKIIEGEGCK
jgi:hypothetical protein